MKLLKLCATLICTVALLAAGGCSLLPENPLYLPPDSAVEVKTSTKVEVWITNASTGQKEARTARIEPGYIIARLALKDECPSPAAGADVPSDSDHAIKK